MSLSSGCCSWKILPQGRPDSFSESNPDANIGKLKNLLYQDLKNITRKKTWHFYGSLKTH